MFNKDKKYINKYITTCRDTEDNGFSSIPRVRIGLDGVPALIGGSPDAVSRADSFRERTWGAQTWYQRLPGRLQQEVDLMARKFPKFVLQVAEEPRQFNGQTVVRAGEAHWIGRLRTHAGNIYAVVITYPDGYPNEQARAFVVQPHIPASPHRYGDGHLCLYSNDHGGGGQGFTAEVTTAVTYVGWVSAWLHAYEIWARKGVWPEARKRA